MFLLHFVKILQVPEVIFFILKAVTNNWILYEVLPNFV